LIQITAGEKHETVAIDATGFSRTNPSFHFVKRMDRANPVRSYAKLSMLFNIDTSKILAMHVRVKPRHDIKDARILLRKQSDMQTLLADKGYDAEWLHQYCFERGIQTVIPQRKSVRKGRFRKKQMKQYSDEKYHRRSIIESGFSAVKRKYGGDVSGKGIVSVRAEIYGKAIAHNLSLS
jgi:IS5 family transposase